ncbi:NADase-type glycan-binding domain-containing protein [Streptomyces sp. NPDC015171]|uniref:NADase-type glycan-binding domain-containing protein n=1 Tax=Streptomyces sp. NPDC015171 TaxID=3364945 RepID=UPI003700A381
MTTPQNCAECGTRAEPGQSFCDACGAVLGWTDRAAARASAASPAAGTTARAGADAPDRAAARPESGPAPADATAPDAPGTAPGARPGDHSATAPDPAQAAAPHMPYAGRPGGPASPPPAPHRTPRPASETASTEPLPAAAPPAPRSDGTTADDGLDRARRLLVPLTDPEARPDAPASVEPVLPGRPEPRRPQTVRAPGEEPGAYGGTPCPWCATLNHPERHYCARCAMPLAGERPETPGRLPWWRRLRWRGDRETPWAGDRPRLRRVFDRVLGWLGAALVVALLVALALVVNIPQGVQATRDHFAKRAPVAPDRYSASRFFPGHKPQLAFDKLNNTWWGPGVADSGQGQWIEARFAEPTRLLDLLITPGESIRPDQLSRSALPHRVAVRVTGADGKTTTRHLNLDQGAGPQRVPFRVGEVTAVRFTLESAYQPSPTKQVAIAEIEFFGPSHAS